MSSRARCVRQPSLGRRPPRHRSGKPHRRGRDRRLPPHRHGKRLRGAGRCRGRPGPGRRQHSCHRTDRACRPSWPVRACVALQARPPEGGPPALAPLEVHAPSLEDARGAPPTRVRLLCLEERERQRRARPSDRRTVSARRRRRRRAAVAACRKFPRARCDLSIGTGSLRACPEPSPEPESCRAAHARVTVTAPQRRPS